MTKRRGRADFFSRIIVARLCSPSFNGMPVSLHIGHKWGVNEPYYWALLNIHESKLGKGLCVCWGLHKPEGISRNANPSSDGLFCCPRLLLSLNSSALITFKKWHSHCGGNCLPFSNIRLYSDPTAGKVRAGNSFTATLLSMTWTL